MKKYELSCKYGCISDTDIIRILKDAKTISKDNTSAVVKDCSTGKTRAIYSNGRQTYFS